MDGNPYQAPQFTDYLPSSTRLTFWRRARRFGFWTGVAGLVGMLGFGLLLAASLLKVPESWIATVFAVNLVICMALSAIGALVLMVAGSIDDAHRAKH